MENSPDNDIEVGRAEKAEEFEESRKPEMFKLWIDLGNRKVQSAAQLGYNHELEESEGLQVLYVADLG
jgi:tRNA-binding protein